MHDGEAAIDEHLVRRLLGEQFPHWADLPLTAVLVWPADDKTRTIVGERINRSAGDQAVVPTGLQRQPQPPRRTQREY